LQSCRATKPDGKRAPAERASWTMLANTVWNLVEAPNKG